LVKKQGWSSIEFYYSACLCRWPDEGL